LFRHKNLWHDGEPVSREDHALESRAPLRAKEGVVREGLADHGLEGAPDLATNRSFVEAFEVPQDDVLGEQI
jgi:hypothetical protein